MEEKVDLELDSQGDIATVAFKATSISNFDGITAAAEEIKSFIQEKAPKAIIFDFEKVKFFSSQVLGLLLEIRAKQKKSDGKVAISGINPQLHRVFTITNLDKIFTFFPSKEIALKSIYDVQ